MAPSSSAARAAETPAPLYYQDPDGKPFYSPTPKKTEDGRDYVAVPAGADISFDEPSSPPEMIATETKSRTQDQILSQPDGAA